MSSASRPDAPPQAAPRTSLSPGTGEVDFFVRLDFDSEESFYGWIERSRKGSPILRLSERLEEGCVLQVESRCGAQRDQFRAKVQQVFRSGADRWGTLLALDTTEGSGEATVGEAGSVAQGAARRAAASEGDASQMAAAGEPEGEADDASSEGQRASGPGGETFGASAIFELKKLNPNQRVLLATRANRQQRRLLLRDTAQPVQMALLSNPRLEAKEVLEIAKNPQSSGGVLQRLSNDQKFSTNYEVQLALVRNPQTPSPIAVRLLDLMRTSDLRYLAKSQALRENVRKAALRVYLKRSP